MRAGAPWCIAIAIGGCFDPTLPEGQPCSETGRCPDGLSCDVATQTCLSQIPEAAKFAQISAYYRHACAIDAAGALYCWGDNEVAMLGTGDALPRRAPARVGTDSDWQQVSAGEDITCGLRAGGALYCWGLIDPPDPVFAPQRVPGTWKSVTTGHFAVCAIAADDSLWCQRTPGPLRQVPFPGVAARVTATHDSVCAIDTGGALYCWGDNGVGQLGTGDLTSRAEALPHQITGAWTQVAFGDAHTCALAADGRIWCWGDCSYDQLGHENDCLTPSPIDSPDTFVSVAAGLDHTCGVRVDGAIACWGNNEVGQLGALGGVTRGTPQPIDAAGPWTAVALGDRFSCALGPDRDAWCWGTNEHGQLGNGHGGIGYEPALVDAGRWTSVTLNDQTACAIRHDRSLWCWGSNAFGQLGDGTKFERRRPVQVGSARDWLAVATGRTATCGLRAPGSLWCWGNNRNRQLGLSGLLDSATPVRVGTREDWTEIAVTETHACGVRAGELHCWGKNLDATPVSTGRAMTSLRGHRDKFLAIENGQAFVWRDQVGTSPDVAEGSWTLADVGDDHVCALRGEGLWCWGDVSAGQLGGPGGSNMPGQERTLDSWSHVDVGTRASCGITSDGRLACWGIEHLVAGGVGIGNLATPTTVGTARWTTVSVGDGDACGIQVDGSLHCWGIGNSGVRGDGRGGHERPTRVAPP